MENIVNCIFFFLSKKEHPSFMLAAWGGITNVYNSLFLI